MALEHSTPSAELTIGPILYNWRPERWRDFYFRVADEAPVSIVYLGEVICSKRSPLFTPHFGPVVNRLENNGKTVVFSTLAEVVTKHDRQLVESVCAPSDALIEANDVSAMAHLRGRRYHAGPHINVYNEQTLAILASEGAQSVCLPPELPATALSQLCAHAATLGVKIEVQVFGRISLALSARCYHARAHGRTKDSCQFVCENDPDGLKLRTLDDRPILAINGHPDFIGWIPELDP
jgi:collagenase-like PrtC family protease